MVKVREFRYLLVARIINPWLKGADCKSAPTVASFYAYPNELDAKCKLAPAAVFTINGYPE